MIAMHRYSEDPSRATGPSALPRPRTQYDALTILLNLIHERGPSLPDKRTTLYDLYVERYFTRETDKSSIVRDHRDLLIEIHQFLGWHMHSQAELSAGSGSIPADRLRALLNSYLRREGRPTEIVDALFLGAVERVGALVARVQGTYEFEVQPLREYFAARYLYETANYSPPGQEASGTLPDRFDSISRNFYWLNVTRYFCGCFSKGELPALVDRVQELAREEPFALLAHPRTLASMLLTDWVFAQHPRSVNQIVEILLEGGGWRHLAARRRAQGSEDGTLVLPEQSGRLELVRRCWELLGEHPPIEQAFELINWIKANEEDTARSARWLALTEASDGEHRTLWFSYGLWLGALGTAPASELIPIATQDEQATGRRAVLLLAAGRSDLVDGNPSLSESAISEVLDGRGQQLFHRRSRSSIAALAKILNPDMYQPAFRREPMSLEAAVRAWLGLGNAAEFDPPTSSNEVLNGTMRAASVFAREAQRSTVEWATSIEPWSNVIEAVRAEFGEQLALARLAVMASFVRSRAETFPGASDMFDTSTPLAHRARHARLNSSAVEWWESTIRRASTAAQRYMALLCVLATASDRTIRELSGLLTEATEAMTSASSVVSTWILMISYPCPVARRAQQQAGGQSEGSWRHYWSGDLVRTCAPRSIAGISALTPTKCLSCRKLGPAWPSKPQSRAKKTGQRP